MGSPLIKLGAFNVCTVYASDFERSLDFYTRVLGMKVDRRMDPGILLDAADGGLTVYLEGGRKPARQLPDEPQTGMCFHPAGGVRAAYETLKAAGIPVVGDYMGGSDAFHMFRIADPDGMVIEFAGKP